MKFNVYKPGMCLFPVSVTVYAFTVWAQHVEDGERKHFFPTVMWKKGQTSLSLSSQSPAAWKGYESNNGLA